MKEESKILIENEVLQLVKLTLETNTKCDRLGNVLYEDMDLVAEKIEEIILRYSQELQEDEEEVKRYLTHILDPKTDNLIRTKENAQVKKIINEQKHTQKGIEKEDEI